MRIAFISTMRGLPWGGSEELWFETAKEAVNQGHEVIASVGHWGKSSSKLFVLESLGVKLHFQSVPRHNLQRSDFAGRFRSKLKEITKGTGYDFSSIKKFKPNIICINQANTHDIPRFPHLQNFLSSQTTPYVAVCHGHEDKPFSNDEARNLTKAYFEKAVWVGFVAQSLINSIERHLASRVSNGFVIRNPVNLSNTSEVAFPAVEKTVCFASVARLESFQKGQDILFETLSDEKWRNRNWQLSLAGEGPHLLYLQELAGHYRVNNKVKFLGQVSDVSKLWAGHHLLLLPSRYEGTPLTLVEAMLCARPAVVTDVAGNCEWITNKVNGFVAEAPTAGAFGKALDSAWEERLQWKKMGVLARQTALKQCPKNPGAVLLDLITNFNHA